MLVSAPTLNQDLIDRIDSFSAEELEGYRRYLPTDLRHYMSEQKKWVEQDIYYLGCELGCKPTPSQIAERVLTGPNSLRYRAYYVLSYPERVYLPDEE